MGISGLEKLGGCRIYASALILYTLRKMRTKLRASGPLEPLKGADNERDWRNYHDCNVLNTVGGAFWADLADRFVGGAPADVGLLKEEYL